MTNGGSTTADFARGLERENTRLRDALEKFLDQFDCYECTGTAEDCLDSLKNADGDARRETHPNQLDG